MASIAELVPNVSGGFNLDEDDPFLDIDRLMYDDDYYAISDIVSKPDSYSFEQIIEKCKSEAVRDIEHRQAIWILCLILFYDGRDNPDNRERVLDLVNEWKIDEAIFYEMKDTAETYRVITTEDNKQDLDQSIKDLIELG